MLEVRDLKVSYGITDVIRNVTFSVPEHSVTALLGGNGAGKTSVLNALSGLVAPAQGSIRLAGAEMTGRHPAEIVRAGMVQVPQGRFVWTRMSVDDNLRLGAITRRDRDIEADRERVFVHFPVLRDKRRAAAGTLSGGEQQMVAIGRALMARPKLLLMDEPSAGLSPLVLDTLNAAILRLAGDGLSILLVEQNIGVAEACAERAIVLANGEIAFETAAAGLTSNSDLLRSYFGK